MKQRPDQKSRGRPRKTNNCGSSWRKGKQLARLQPISGAHAGHSASRGKAEAVVAESEGEMSIAAFLRGVDLTLVGTTLKTLLCSDGATWCTGLLRHRNEEASLSSSVRAKK